MVQAHSEAWELPECPDNATILVLWWKLDRPCQALLTFLMRMSCSTLVLYFHYEQSGAIMGLVMCSA